MSLRERYGRTAGRIAAGTLGFIAGDVPGAVAGVAAYNRFSK